MTGIICAMDKELEGFLHNMTIEETLEKSGVTFYKGLIKNTPAVIAESGVGKVNAAVCARMMIDFFEPEVIINSGIAGALSEKLTVYDVVVGEFAVQHDFDCTALGEEKGLLDVGGGEMLVRLPLSKAHSEKLFEAAERVAPKNVYMGTVATGDKFVGGDSERLAIGKEFSALVCEMEGGAMAQVCYRAGVPFVIVRAVSDDLTHNTEVEYFEFKPVAAKLTVDIVLSYLS